MPLRAMRSITSASSTSARTTAGPSALAIHLAADGTACTAAGPALACWRPDGTIAELPPLPYPITALVTLDDHRVVVSVTDRASYLIDLRSREVRGLITGASGLDVDEASHLAAAILPDGSPLVLDLDTATSWPLAAQLSLSRTPLALAPGGALVATIAGGDRLLTWPLDLPGTPEATAAWLDRISNAFNEHGPGKLSWK